MKKEQLIKFIKDFNNSEPLCMNTLKDCLVTLKGKDLQLFILLANHKNGADFKSKLKGGNI